MNFNFKNLSISVIFAFYSIISNSQELKSKNIFWDNVHFGGGLGLNFSNGYTNIAVTPSGIYEFNEKFAGGIGLNINYSSKKNDFEAIILGASLITLFKPVKEIQLSVELEENNVQFKDKIYSNNSNYWNTSLYLGAGYAIGNFGAVGVRYDVLFDENKSVYGTAFLPFISVFF